MLCHSFVINVCSAFARILPFRHFGCLSEINAGWFPRSWAQCFENADTTWERLKRKMKDYPRLGLDLQIESIFGCTVSKLKNILSCLCVFLRFLGGSRRQEGLNLICAYFFFKPLSSCARSSTQEAARGDMTYRGHAVSIPAEKIRSKVMLNAQLLTRNATDAKQLDEWCNESSLSFLGFAGWGCVWSQPKRCRWELLQMQRSRLEQSLLVCSFDLSTGWCWFRESRSSFDWEVRWLSQHCLRLRLSRSQRTELQKMSKVKNAHAILQTLSCLVWQCL